MTSDPNALGKTGTYRVAERPVVATKRVMTVEQRGPSSRATPAKSKSPEIDVSLTSACDRPFAGIYRISCTQVHDPKTTVRSMTQNIATAPMA